MDTGIRSTHKQFGGRAIPTAEFLEDEHLDCIFDDASCAKDMNGHGSHVGSTAAGATHGVARGAVLHAVKTLRDDGKGQFSRFLSALDWACGKAQPGPKVASASLGILSRSEIFANALAEVMQSGLTVVVSAGNEAEDACNYSPAFSPDVITVGAVDGSRKHASFSNYGECMDVLAPGVDFFSVGIESDDATDVMSGTSMAAPHVSGVVALLLQEDPTRLPRKIVELIRLMALKDVTGDLKPWQSNLFLHLAEKTPSLVVPEELKGWATVEGPCPKDPETECITSSNFPHHYPMETCNVTVNKPVMISAVSFSTVGWRDKLTFNGRAYSGTLGPQFVVPTGVIAWASEESSQERGWQLCPAVTTTTTTMLEMAGIVADGPAAPLQCGLKGRDSTPWMQAQIVRGQKATPCEWRWQAGLRRTSTFGFPFCAGTLISDRWVLTAAHCVLTENKTSFFVRLGNYDRLEMEDTVVDRNVSRVFLHPEYTGDHTIFDFALVKLKDAVEPTSCIGHACLPENEQDVVPGSSCWITGWGSSTFKGSMPRDLQEARVEILKQEDCVAKLGADRGDESSICAAGVDSLGRPIDACEGDSGGPLVCESGGQYTVYGATSWGVGCARDTTPGVWARVANQMQWIHAVSGLGVVVPTPAPPSLPESAHWKVSGPCEIVNSAGRECVTSSGFEKGAKYAKDESCTLSVGEGMTIFSPDFRTEKGFDVLTVNGEKFDGRSGPEDIIPTEPMTWTSDDVATSSGWKLCVRVAPKKDPKKQKRFKDLKDKLQEQSVNKVQGR